MKVLVTGASGQAGPGVVNALAKRHKLRLTDLIKSDKLSIYPWVVGSMTDHQTLAKAVNGMDAVVHMARVFRHPGTDPTTDDFLDVNVKGTYLLLEAAAKAGVKVFVHISSTAHVIGNWY